MQYADPDLTWSEWVAENANVVMPDFDRLAALREYITETARTHVRNGDCTADWADKKLAKLGITDRVGILHSYTVECTVTGTLSMVVPGRNRTEALDTFNARLTANNSLSWSVRQPSPQGPQIITAGPEDVDPSVVDPDTPATVQDTLDMLREIVMLGNVAGPRFDCETGVNRVLASYGLAPLPQKREFAVHRPVEGVMVTIVEAYDEASAERVAGWRWNNGRSGYNVTEAVDAGDVTVVGRS